MQFLIDILIIAIVTVIECDIGKSLQAASAIFQRQVVVGVPLVVFPSLTGGHQTESIAQRLQGLDKDHGIHFGIVFRTRGSNHIHALDVCRFQLFQVTHITHLLIIDVDLGLTLGQHLKLTILALHHRYYRQQIGGIADVVEQRVLYIDGYATRCLFVLRSLAFNLNTFHHIGLRLEGEGTDVAHADVSGNGLIADIRHSQCDALGLTGYYEIAILIAHASVNICGILIIVLNFYGVVQ